MQKYIILLFYFLIQMSWSMEAQVTDLELLEVKIEDHEKIHICGPANSADVYLLRLKGIKIGMVNRGDTTINEVLFFMEMEGIENCVSASFGTIDYQEEKELELLHLSPGDTTYRRVSSFNVLRKREDSLSVNICAWHTLVNHQEDHDDSNNHFCGEIELKKEFEELPIVTPREKEVLIYPNPLNEILKVSLLQAPFEPTLVEFYDFVGRRIGQKYFIAPRAKYKEFDISEIPSGFYFLRVSNDLINEGFYVYVN